MRKRFTFALGNLALIAVFLVPAVPVAAGGQGPANNPLGRWNATFICLPTCIPGRIVPRVRATVVLQKVVVVDKEFVYLGSVHEPYLVTPPGGPDAKELDIVRDPNFGFVSHTKLSSLHLVFDGKSWHGGGI